MKQFSIKSVCLMALGAFISAISFARVNSSEIPWDWGRDAQLPAHFPKPIVPANNPITEDKVALGRHLFYDKRLSGNGTQSCASCHIQEKAFTDGRTVALGSTGQFHLRNSQGLSNVAYNSSLTWANPLLLELERQVEIPLFGENPVEMGINNANQDEVLKRLRDDADYQRLFMRAFGGHDSITWKNIVYAIASFERTIISADSKYDQWLQGKAELTPSELRGMNLFNSEKAECFHCHSGFNFNDQAKFVGLSEAQTTRLIFHNTGLYNLPNQNRYPEGNRGVFEISNKAKDMGAFRAPSLRNVALTAPYMHDGSFSTLEAVIEHYAAGGTVTSSGSNVGDGRLNSYKSELITGFSLTTQEKIDLINFLKTLTDDSIVNNPKLSNPLKP